MIQEEGKQFVLLWRNTLSSHGNVFIFTQRMHKPTKRQFTKENVLNSTFKGCIFVLKHFDQSQELQTMAKKFFTILRDSHYSHIRFLCYLDSDENLL